MQNEYHEGKEKRHVNQLFAKINHKSCFFHYRPQQGRHTLWADTPRQTPPSPMATATDGTHSTDMHSGAFIISFIPASIVPFFFFSSFQKNLVDTWPFIGPLIPLFCTSGDVPSGFQSQSDQPYSHLVASMAAKKFSSTYLQTNIGGAQDQDRSCRCLTV